MLILQRSNLSHPCSLFLFMAFTVMCFSNIFTIHWGHVPVLLRSDHLAGSYHFSCLTDGRTTFRISNMILDQNVTFEISFKLCSSHSLTISYYFSVSLTAKSYWLWSKKGINQLALNPEAFFFCLKWLYRLTLLWSDKAWGRWEHFFPPNVRFSCLFWRRKIFQ